MTLSVGGVTSGGIGRLPDVLGEEVMCDGACPKCEKYRAVILKAPCFSVFVLRFCLRLELSCWHERVVRWIPSTSPKGPTRKVMIAYSLLVRYSFM
jgi:hypothetical protein